VLQCVAVCCNVTCISRALVRFTHDVPCSRCVAAYCGVLQCVAAYCCVLQCVAVCCSALQHIAVCCSVLQCDTVCCRYVAVCCGVLRCVAMCCSVLQCVAVCCSVLQCVAMSPAYRENLFYSLPVQPAHITNDIKNLTHMITLKTLRTSQWEHDTQNIENNTYKTLWAYNMLHYEHDTHHIKNIRHKTLKISYTQH